MIIYLGRLLPTCSCGPPEAPTLEGRKTSRSGYISLLLFDLTPDRGCPADALLRAPVVSYTTISPLLNCFSGLFLWPDPVSYLTPGITRHPALWSADFPQRLQEAPRPPDQPTVISSYLYYGFQSITRQVVEAAQAGYNIFQQDDMRLFRA